MRHFRAFTPMQRVAFLTPTRFPEECADQQYRRIRGRTSLVLTLDAGYG